jgi:hypothetical protein
LNIFLTITAFRVESDSQLVTKSKFDNNLSEMNTPNGKLSSTVIGTAHGDSSTTVSPNKAEEDMNNKSLNLSHVTDSGHFTAGGKVYLLWDNKKFTLHNLTNSLSKYEMHILEYYK